MPLKKKLYVSFKKFYIFKKNFTYPLKKFYKNYEVMLNPMGISRCVSVPVEATAVLGAVAGFVVLLLALFLYLSRKWCFTPPSSTTLFGGVCVPLCESTNSSTSQISKNIGTWSWFTPWILTPANLANFYYSKYSNLFKISPLFAIIVLNLLSKSTK